MMLRRVDELVEAGADFAVETTLANLALRAESPGLAAALGYLVSLVYLRLQLGSSDAIARVRKRVAAGGHGIPEDAVRRRFGT